MALSTAVCSAVTIKSAYLSKSFVDKCPEKSSEPSASSSVDSNTSVRLVKFVPGGVSECVPMWCCINCDFDG